MELKANQESPGDQLCLGLKSILGVQELMTLGHRGNQLPIGKFSSIRVSQRDQSLSISLIKTGHDILTYMCRICGTWC